MKRDKMWTWYIRAKRDFIAFTRELRYLRSYPKTMTREECEQAYLKEFGEMLETGWTIEAMTVGPDGIRDLKEMYSELAGQEFNRESKDVSSVVGRW